MYIILGSTGYIGQAFISYFKRKGISHIGLSRSEVDYTHLEKLRSWLDINWQNGVNGGTVINCAGYIGKPNVDQCEFNKGATIMGNVVFPSNASNVCRARGIKFAHISSGCIYSGSNEFTEEDEPNFTLDSIPPGSFYSGSKALAENAVSKNEYAYQFRLRIPFDEIASPRNYITKCLTYDNLIDVENSVSHRGDFVKYCIEILEGGAPWGIYNVCNTGAITTRQVTDILSKYLPERVFKFYPDYDSFDQDIAAPRSNCTLSTKKLERYVTVRSAEDALLDAIQQYTNNIR